MPPKSPCNFDPSPKPTSRFFHAGHPRLMCAFPYTSWRSERESREKSCCLKVLFSSPTPLPPRLTSFPSNSTVVAGFRAAISKPEPMMELTAFPTLEAHSVPAIRRRRRHKSAIRFIYTPPHSYVFLIIPYICPIAERKVSQSYGTFSRFPCKSL
ncbi:hypothetical protein SDC9_146618 [bioreactor metagenome]|uniref:Uncharacterized protein n=1 Tax=bioreactor metagenome TaxID=1076179 RepID=A0A645EBS1_9ZZZZ